MSKDQARSLFEPLKPKKCEWTKRLSQIECIPMAERRVTFTEGQFQGRTLNLHEIFEELDEEEKKDHEVEFFERFEEEYLHQKTGEAEEVDPFLR